jgi:hypothetical protein
MLATMIVNDNPRKATSILDSCSSVAASKYLKGDRYLRNARFSCKLEMTDRK